MFRQAILASFLGLCLNLAAGKMAYVGNHCEYDVHCAFVLDMMPTVSEVPALDSSDWISIAKGKPGDPTIFGIPSLVNERDGRGIVCGRKSDADPNADVAALQWFTADLIHGETITWQMRLTNGNPFRAAGFGVIMGNLTFDQLHPPDEWDQCYPLFCKAGKDCPDGQVWKDLDHNTTGLRYCPGTADVFWLLCYSV